MSQKLWLILTFVLIACGQEDKDNIDNVSNSDGGRCYFTSSGDNVQCIEYPNSTAALDASANCQSVYNQGSFSGYNYESGENSDCPGGSSLLGTCSSATETTGNVFYYDDSNFWNATTAEADCTSFMNGTWSAN